MEDLQKESKPKGKQFRWTTAMTTVALQILVNEALKGNKPTSTFKPSSFVRVANEVSEKCGNSYLAEHVDNHLRTIKKDWNTIVQLRKKSGFGWDKNLKMITADQNVYDEEVATHPSHAKFLNKKIAMYDEMAIVVGKDMATGAYAKYVSNINMDETIDLDGVTLEDDISMFEEVPASKVTPIDSSASSKKRSHRKRNHSTDDESNEKIYEQFSNMAAAIRELGTSTKQAQKEFVDGLFREVMTVEGYNEFDLSRVFDYLVQHELITTAFLLSLREVLG